MSNGVAFCCYLHRHCIHRGLDVTGQEERQPRLAELRWVDQRSPRSPYTLQLHGSLQNLRDPLPPPFWPDRQTPQDPVEHPQSSQLSISIFPGHRCRHRARLVRWLLLLPLLLLL